MINLKVNGTKATIRVIRRGMTFKKIPFHREAASYLQRAIRQGIRSERDLVGVPFAKLSDVTASSKRGNKTRGHAHILVDTGGMQKAIVPAWDEKAGRVGFGDRTHASIGSHHQHGTARMPKRSFMGIRNHQGQNDVQAIEKIAERHFEKA